MSKVNFNKIKLALVAVLFAIVYVCVGTMMFAKAEETLNSASEVTTFEMSGAELIVEGEDGVNGLKFTASISEAEYNALKAANADFETGVVIMPFDFKTDDIEADMFGENAIYDWAIWNGSSYVYTKSDKIQVVNINANDWVDAGNVMTYSGGIVDIQDQNETVAFASIAYVKTVDEGGVASYAWTKIASTSIALEVEKVYEDLTESQQAWVDANWTKLGRVKADTILSDVAGKETVGIGSVVDVEAAQDLMKSIGYDFPSVKLVKGETEVVFDTSNVQEEPAIAVDSLSEGVWTVEMVADGVLVYTGLVDIYNSADGVVWNKLDNLADFGAYYGNDQTKEFIAMRTIGGQATEFDGKKVLEISNMITHAGKVPGEVFMNLAPIHTKEYYERYVGYGAEFTYSFYYTVNEDVDGTGKGPVDKNGEPTNWYIVNQYSYYGASGRSTGAIKASDAFFNTWRTVTIDLDTLIADWDNIVNLKDATYAWGNGKGLGMLYALTSNLGSLGGMEETGLKLYVAGFDVSLDLAALATKGGDILVKLDDVDKTALDITSYMKKEDVDMLSQVSAVSKVSYEMKGYSIADTIAVSDLAKVDVSNAKEAAYVLNAKVGDAIVYTATIDLYTSTSPVVWAESMTSYNTVLRKIAVETGLANWVTNNAVLMTEGVDYEFVNELTVGSKTYNNSYVKVTVKEQSAIAFDVKALHTKAYYQEMSDLTKVLHIRGFFPSSVSMDANFSANNYGMNNSYSSWRNSTSSNTYESIVISMDNYLIASDNNTASGKFYNWDGITSDKTGTNTMVQFEIPASKATADAPFVFYLGDVNIEEAGETLIASAGKYTTTNVDMNGQFTYDLINLIPENQQAKYRAMAAKWVGKNGKYITGNAIGWQIGINIDKTTDKDGKQELNTNNGDIVFSVVPDATGATILDLNTQVTAEYTIGKLFKEYPNDIWVRGYAAPIVSMGVGSWPVYMASQIQGFKFSNLPEHICDFAKTYTNNETEHWFACSGCDLVDGKAAHEFAEGVCVCGYKDPTYGPEGTFNIAEYEDKYAEEYLTATKGASLSSIFTEEMLADFATLEENGYAVTYVAFDLGEMTEAAYGTADEVADFVFTSAEYEVTVLVGEEGEVQILYAIVTVAE